MKRTKGKAAAGDDEGLVDNILLSDIFAASGEDHSVEGRGGEGRRGEGGEGREGRRGKGGEERRGEGGEGRGGEGRGGACPHNDGIK